MAHFKDIITTLIYEISGQKRTLSVPRVFINMTGSLYAAFFLSQALYWSDRGKAKGGWFWKTYQEWNEEIALSEYQVRKAAQDLKRRKVLQTKIRKANGNPTVHYKIDKDEFLKWVEEYLEEKECIETPNIYEQQKFIRGERGNFNDLGAVAK